MSTKEIIELANEMMKELDEALNGLRHAIITLTEDRYEEIMSFYELNSQSRDYLVEEAMIQLEEYISCFEAQMTKLESQGLF